MKPSPVPPGFRRVRRNVFIQEHVHDSYKQRGKPAEPTVCPECGAVFHKGRWQNLPAPARARKATCPACHRIRDHYPAGFLTLEGGFLGDHRDEIVHLLRHVESRERAEHPLQRIMEIDAEGGAMTVTTTDPHLARSLGEAVRHAYRGKLEFHYNPEEYMLRVRWTR
jgi:NMD protein affecting ribosome stability and mRNA decay